MDTEEFNSYRHGKEAIGATHGMINNHVPSSATDTSDDSDSSGSDVQWKRQKKTKKMLCNPLKNGSDNTLSSMESKPKRNCVWTNVLTEQILTENVTYCGIDTVSERTRAVESYNYKRNNMQTDSKPNVKTRVGYQQEDTSVPRKNFGKLNLPEKRDKLAFLLAKQLNEPKRHLIENVVKEVGKKKAMELFQRTMKIEANGGEQTANGLRRRSPGGVFFMLLKQDPDVRKAQINNIFKDEKEIVKKRKKVIQSNKRRQKCLQLKKKLETTQMDIEIASASSTKVSFEKYNDSQQNNSIPESIHKTKHTKTNTEIGELVDNIDELTNQNMLAGINQPKKIVNLEVSNSFKDIDVPTDTGNMDDDELEPGEIV